MGADLCACDEVDAEATSTAPAPISMKIDRGGPVSPKSGEGLRADDSRTKMMVPMLTKPESPPESPHQHH